MKHTDSEPVKIVGAVWVILQVQHMHSHQDKFCIANKND